MAKRGANEYLTDSNWDNEEEVEEAGIFKQADKDTISTRKIKTAKRRNIGASIESESGNVSVFKGFTGFKSTTNTAKPNFSFGGIEVKPLTGQANPLFGKPSFKSTEAEAKEMTDSDDNKTSSASSVKSNSDASKRTQNGDKNCGKKYMSQLKALNNSVSKWIEEHVTKNPYCILTPIFSDYDKHLADIEKNYGDKKVEEVTEEADTSDASTKQSDKEEIVAVKEKKDDTTATKSETSGFKFGTFGASPAPASSLKPLGAGSSSLFSSTTSSTSSTTFTGFSFGNQACTFGSAKPAEESTNNTNKNEEEEYVPPEPESSKVVEDDAFFTKRCKLFYKVGEVWKDYGVGNLHLKPCDDKTQLLIRADNTLGTVLLNIMLQSSMPISRSGKNNVMMMCVPNPALPDKTIKENTAASMLIRVKTAEEADDLLDKLTDAKSK